MKVRIILPALTEPAGPPRWKRFDALWDFIIRVKQATRMLPLRETIPEDFGKHGNPEEIASLSLRPQVEFSAAELYDR